MDILLTAIMLGLVGSFHCVGMCGPIAISLPLKGNNLFHKAMNGLIYNIGRTMTYVLLGVLLGMVGQGVELYGFQQGISILMGITMLSVLFFPKLLKGQLKLPFTAYIQKWMGPLFNSSSRWGLLLLGFLNGLLPCGLVYMAIVGALGTGGFFSSILFMLLFGLSTIPMMLFISLSGQLISASFRNNINKIIPYIVAIIGILFILRGLGLGIPFLSPPTEKLKLEYHEKAKMGHTPPQVEHACCKTKK